MIKRIFCIVTLIIGVLFAGYLLMMVLTSCEKQEYYIQSNVYDIPENTIISDCKLMHRSVLIEWVTTDGSHDTFSSTISDYEYLGRETYIYEINNNILSSHIFVGLIIYTDTITNERKVFALKPSDKEVQQVWNEDSKAPIGVIEDSTKIVIYTNNMNSPIDKQTMCMKLTILK